MRLALCIAAVAIAAGSAIGATPTAKTTPAGTLKAEIAAFNAKNYRAAYAAYTARFKARCPYATFAKHTAQQRAMAPAPIAVRIKTSHITGARATLTYDILLAGQQVSHVTAKSPDIFVRIKGLWYDDIDAQTSC